MMSDSEIHIGPDKDGGYCLSCGLFLELPRDAVFPFFADARNLERITPPVLQFHITSSDLDMRKGLLIDYRLKLRGVPIRWQSLISRWEPPFTFVDEQVVGPYRYWHHTHTFEETSGGTWVRDVVRYKAPGGSVLHQVIVKPDLLKIFAYRQETIRTYFSGTAATSAGVC